MDYTKKTNEDLVFMYQKGDMRALDQLRINVGPIVNAQVNRYISGPGHISRAALMAKADELLVDAARTYKRGTGAAFTTHLFNHLRRLDRYTKANANIAKMPEARANSITNFQNRVKELEDIKGRPPTDEEIADYMNIPVEEVRRMKKSLGREISESQLGGVSSVPYQHGNPVLDQLLEDIYFELTPDEKIVFDHLFGRHGKKKLKTGNEIARATGFSPAKVSQLRASIARKMKPHIGTTTGVDI